MDAEKEQQEARERVQRGYDWLAVDGPAFGCDLSRIVPDSIDMGHANACVLSQAAGLGYWDALRRIIPNSEDWGERSDWAREHGFWADPEFGDPSYAALEEAWRELLPIV